jgi:hypothetical protein
MYQSKTFHQRIIAVSFGIIIAALIGFFATSVESVSAQSETGSITLVTTSNPAGAVDFFYFGGLGSILQNDGDSHQQDRIPGDYQIYQSVPAGWVVDISCTGGSVEIGAGNILVHLAAGDDVVCTFSNSDIGGSITIVSASNPAGASDLFYFGGLGSFTQNDGDSRLSDNQMPGDYQIYQSVPTGWSVEISCVGGDATVGNGNVIVHLGANEDVVCTFNNLNVGGSITILNASDGGSGFYYYGNLGSFSLDDSQNRVSSDLLPGDYQVYQSIPQAWELAISCVGGDATVSGDNVIVHLGANEDVVCTFSNSDVGSSITINTSSNPAGGSGYFYFGNAGSFSLDDGQSHTSDRLLAGDYQIYQSVPAGGTVDISCDGGNVEIGNGTILVHLGSNEDVVCTFANSDLGGSITLVTHSDPAGTPDFYYFGGLGSFTQNDGQSKVSDNLLPGDYQVYQSVWAGWTLDISCDGGDVEIGNGTIIVHLGANEDVVCTFDNSDVGGSITIVNNADLEDGREFTYFGNIGFFILTAGDSREAADLYPGEYEVIQGVPQGWLVDVSCTGGAVDIVDTTLSIHLGANEDIVCTFNNSYVGGSITVNTMTVPANGSEEFFYFGDTGVYTQTHGLSRTVSELYPNDYDVIQGVPEGYTLSVDCSGGSVTAINGGVTIQLGARDNVTCTFTNTAANYVDDTAPFCRGVEATIYVNTLGIIVGGPDAGQAYAGVLNGTAGDDVMLGTPGSDVINGYNGRDMICARSGADTVYGGRGRDTIYGGRGADLLHGEQGSDLIFGGWGADEIHGGGGEDVLAGRRGNDTIYGEGDTDLIAGGLGDDVLNGNGGDDFLRGGQGEDSLNGGNGYDFCFGGADRDNATNCEYKHSAR